VGPHPGGPDWMPITPKTGSLFHADSQKELLRNNEGWLESAPGTHSREVAIARHWLSQPHGGYRHDDGAGRLGVSQQRSLRERTRAGL
jgi:hypothetical protein